MAFREFNFPCSQCTNGVSVEWSAETVETIKEVSCHRCHHAFHLTPNESPEFSKGGPIDRCLLCGSNEFYIQKDFSRWLGVLLVIVACILAPFTYFLSLVVVTLLDVWLFRRLGLVTVCYGCEGIYRGQPLHPQHEGFDLRIRDKYRFST